MCCGSFGPTVFFVFASNMVYHEHIILEAIDQLRLRKARPDFHRISNFLIRNFAVTLSDIKTSLERCIQKQIVLKVEYKGNISYRNATRNRKSKHSNMVLSDNANTVKSPAVINTGPSKKFKALLINAFTELIVHEPDYLYDGVPGNELIAKILSKDSVRSYTKKYLGILIEKLVANGMLQKLPGNGNYLLGPNLNEEFGVNKIIVNKTHTNPNNNKGMKNPQKKIKMEAGGNSNSSKGNNVRVGSRRKRAKKVFDPSDNNIPKRRGRPPILHKTNNSKEFLLKPKSKDSSDNEAKTEICSRESGGVCSVCHNNKKYANDHLVCCRECSNKAHFSCLNGGDDMMLKLYPDNTWRCPHCKTCCTCYETSDAGVLMVCSICADAYHSSCHDPPITEKYQNGTKWCCNNCQMSEMLQITEIHPNVQTNDIIKHEVIEEQIDIKDEVALSHSPISLSDDDSKDSMHSLQTAPTLSPQITMSSPPTPPQNGTYNFQSYTDTQDKIDPSIPDATDWTTEDVYNYFVQYFPEEAKVFKEQEIDGRSLLLMKRLDILTSLKLKLGPALNIYRHVVKLQFRRDDPKLYWL